MKKRRRTPGGGGGGGLSITGNGLIQSIQVAGQNESG